jgi:hypothetical protein
MSDNAVTKRGRGKPRLIVSDRMKARLTRLYVRDGLSVREVAAALGIGDAAARRRLHAAGIAMRSNIPRSRLRKLDQARLMSDLIDFGVDRTALKRGIPVRTLKFYLAGLRRSTAKADRKRK